jgi:hypothetical protein
MPERKGRKRRQTRERKRAGDQTATAMMDAVPTPMEARPRASQPASSKGPLPSTTARVTGLMIAVLTMFLAVLMVYQTVTGDASGIDGMARIVGGIVMIALGIAVGVLSVAPGLVRDWFARGR